MSKNSLVEQILSGADIRTVLAGKDAKVNNSKFVKLTESYLPADEKVKDALRKAFDLDDEEPIEKLDDDRFKVGDDVYRVLTKDAAREEFEEHVDDLLYSCGTDVFGDTARYILVDLDYAQNWMEDSESQFLYDLSVDELRDRYIENNGDESDYDWNNLSDDDQEEIIDKLIKDFVEENACDEETFMDYMNWNFGDGWYNDSFWKDSIYPDYDILISDFGLGHELSDFDEEEIELPEINCLAFRVEE